MHNKTFEYTIYIAADRKRIWEALTSKEATTQYFFKREVQSDWKEGSTVRYVTETGELDVEGEILKVIPFETLCFTWRHAEDHSNRTEPTMVTFSLKSLEETTKLTVEHSNLLETDWSDDKNTFYGLNNGWPAIMSNLKSYLEIGKTMPPMNI
ncbi:SRPBCC domain-containing protein [Pontibacillus salicampi]|uniref:SRPBCC domain-containing protein n=1 Tax=Pontibacillus salicampi TaxID=1449801 RepID=A0ABV6LMQ3_9BACI